MVVILPSIRHPSELWRGVPKVDSLIHTAVFAFCLLSVCHSWTVCPCDRTVLEANVREQLLFTEVFPYQGSSPERLWWDTRLAWMGLKTTWPCRKCPAHGSELELGGLLKTLPTQTCLWSCDSAWITQNFQSFLTKFPKCLKPYSWFSVLLNSSFLPPLVLCQSCQYFRYFLLFGFLCSIQMSEHHCVTLPTEHP